MIIVKPCPCPHPDDWMNADPSAPLQEMASPPDKVWKHLTQYGAALVEHLFKLFYFREFNEYYGKWTESVYKCAFQVPKLSSPPKYKNKLPPAEMIYEWMWGRWEDQLDIQHSIILDKINDKSYSGFKYLPYVYAGGNPENACAFVKNYHLWLAGRLSKDGKVSLDDVRTEIKLLLKKYPV
jgi:hypothetical protein